MFVLLHLKKSIRFKLLVTKAQFEQNKEMYLRKYNVIEDKDEIIRYAEEYPKAFAKLGIKLDIEQGDSTREKAHEAMKKAEKDRKAAAKKKKEEEKKATEAKTAQEATKTKNESK